MNEKEKKPMPKWLEKLKKVKHIEVYVAIIFIVILLLIFTSSFDFNKNSSSEKLSDEMTVTSYVNNLERNLEEILSNIGGVKNVKVMITLDMAMAEVTDSKINLDKFPGVKGVVVTANGVKDTATKLKVLSAVEAVIDVRNGNIEILSSD